MLRTSVVTGIGVQGEGRSEREGLAHKAVVEDATWDLSSERDCYGFEELEKNSGR